MSMVEKVQKFLDDKDKQNAANIAVVNDIYTSALREELGVQGDPKHPSTLGQAPHRVTGRLQDSIIGEVDGLKVNAGTTADYGKYLLSKRPYLRLAYEKVAAQIRQILLNNQR